VPLSSYGILPEHDTEPMDIHTMPRPGHDKENSSRDVEMSFGVAIVEAFLSLCTFRLIFDGRYFCWKALWMLCALAANDEQAVKEWFAAERGIGRRRLGLL
jgi:hypothetical protein